MIQLEQAAGAISHAPAIRVSFRRRAQMLQVDVAVLNLHGRADMHLHSQQTLPQAVGPIVVVHLTHQDAVDKVLGVRTLHDQSVSIPILGANDALELRGITDLRDESRPRSAIVDPGRLAPRGQQSAPVFLVTDASLGASGGAVYAMKGPDVAVLSAGFPAAGVNALGERGGAIYAGTIRGLYVWGGTEWSNSLVPEPCSRTAIFSLLRVESDLFEGGVKGLLLLDRKGEARALSGKDGVPEAPVTALAASGKTLFAATDSGVVAVEGWDE